MKPKIFGITVLAFQQSLNPPAEHPGKRFRCYEMFGETSRRWLEAAPRQKRGSAWDAAPERDVDTVPRCLESLEAAGRNAKDLVVSVAAINWANVFDFRVKVFEHIRSGAAARSAVGGAGGAF